MIELSRFCSIRQLDMLAAMYTHQRISFLLQVISIHWLCRKTPVAPVVGSHAFTYIFAPVLGIFIAVGAECLA